MKFILSICFWGGSTGLYAPNEQFAWLIGTWQEDRKMSFEVWKDEGSFLSGGSYQVDQSGNRTVTEEIKLIKRGNYFYYIPDGAGPRGPIEFKITAFDYHSLIAENPDHDFPKRIGYKKTDDRLEAIISGGSNAISYTFKKIK